MKIFYQVDLQAELTRRIAQNGLRATAREMEVSAPFLGDVAHRNRGISDKVAIALGFEPLPQMPVIRRWRRKVQ